MIFTGAKDFRLNNFSLLFQGICREVDQKRDDMKRLVQMLDVLISKSGVTSEEKYLEEQDKLESLISRYKNLVPTIEITMVKTEITSRCYTYREETERVSFHFKT